MLSPEVPPPPPVSEWHRLADLPAGTGVAGAAIGVWHDRLWVAGGAAFPDGPPAKGGRKVYTDRILVLDHPDAPAWREVPQRLPAPLGYGAALSLANGDVLLVGGGDDQRATRDVWRVTADGSFAPLPPLPQPLMNFSAGEADGLVVVAGGQTGSQAEPHALAWALDLADLPAGWFEIAPLPGPARHMAPAAVLRSRDAVELVVISGKTPRKGQPTATLTDAFAWSFATRTWRRLAPPPVPVMAAAAVPLDARHVLVLGGGAYEFLQRTEARTREIARLRAAGDTMAADHLAALSAADVHPGFQPQVRSYDLLADAWQTAGRLPHPSPPVNTSAVRWHDRIVIVSGEIRPAIRTESVWALSLHPRSTRPPLGPQNIPGRVP